MEDGMNPSAVRHDRKYYVSLALHEAIRDHLRTEPERVFDLGLRGARKVLPHSNGNAERLVYEWIRLLQERDVDDVSAILTADTEHAAEMRNVAVFLGVLSAEQRREVLNGVYERAEYER